jgi:cytochrome c
VTFKSHAGLLSAFYGIALLTAGLFFDFGAPQPSAQVTATPTLDRLAEPTLPASPSQADRGAQVYWLSCLPCHGDRGQGLTDEFIRTYPPEDRNCWESGCHGDRPYQNGFKLPASIPPVIGAEALGKFSNAAVLQAYIKAAMPFWKPGSLAEEDAWAVTAFLLRESGIRAARAELNAANAGQVQISTAASTEAPGSPSAAAMPATCWLAGLLLIAVLVFMVLWMRRSRNGT